MAVRAKNAEIRTITGNLSGNATSATTATNDTKGQAITSYIRALSISGRTITYTKGDGTTGTITTQDTNTTYTLVGLVGSTAIGSTTQPIYWDGSKFTTIGYTIAKSVPSNAVFTDKYVTQTAVTPNGDFTAWRPMVWGASFGNTEGFTPSTVTDGVLTCAAFSCQPSTGTIRATKFKGALEGNASTATTATKLGTSTVGGTAKPIYLNAGTATALSATVGSADEPVYLNAGTITTTGKKFSNYLPLSGGTITGDLTVNGITKLNILRSSDDSYRIKYAKSFSNTDLGINAGTADSQIAKALLKALCSTYPGLDGFIFEGRISPNSNAYYKVYIYNTSGVNSDGLPQYSFGEFYKYHEDGANFGTSEFTYHFRRNITSHQDISGKQDKSTAVTHAANTAVGSATKPIYVASTGVATASNASVGSADIPVYMSNGTITASTKKFSDYLPLAGGTMTGNLNFSQSSVTRYISWIDATYQQRIQITDDSAANTAVFTFQQSSNSGSSWSDLFTIKDNGEVVATKFTGALNGNATSASSCSGNAGSASKLLNSRNIKLAGAVTGTGSFDGSKDITITTTKNHTHTKSEITDFNKELTSENLNDIKDAGFYFAQGSNSVTNKPTNVDAFGLIVIQSAGLYRTQILYASNNSWKVFLRWFNSSAWSAWTEEELTDTTYTASNGVKIESNVIKHTNSVTAATAQGDASKTLTFGGTFTIPTVTYDAQGHITAKGTTTMTMPANPNTDTKVTNTLANTTKAYVTGTTTASTNTGTQVFDSGVYITATAGQLNATSYKVADKVTLQYNSTNECLDFVFG